MRNSFYTKLLSTLLIGAAPMMWAGMEKQSASSLLYAQSKAEVSGVVVDDKGEAVIGAAVIVKGRTGVGAQTDLDGRFRVPAKVGETLQVSYMGYRTVEVKVTSNQPLKITLQEDAKQLSEVVVTALGIKRQTKALAYNVTELKGEDLLTNKDANFVNSLNGKVAGLTINQSSSGVGSAAKVVMRGSKSIEKSNNAIYVVDGVPLFSTTMKQGEGQFGSAGSTESAADINPDDIESVTILTGASAAALYGSAAANGAVLITTKKGKKGGIKVDYSYSGEMGRPLLLPNFQSRYGADGGLDSWGRKIAPGGSVFDINNFFQTSYTDSHSLSVSGGGEKNQVYASLAATSNKGIIPNNKYSRYNVNIRNTTSLLDDRLRLDAGFNYIKQYHRNMVNQGEYMNPMVPAYLMPRSVSNEEVKVYETFDINKNYYVQNWLYGKGEYTLQNPYWVAYRNLREMSRERYVLSFSAAYDLIRWSQSDSWVVSGRVRSDNTFFKFEDKRYATTEPTLDVSANGYYGLEQGKDRQTYADLMTTLNKGFDGLGQNWNLNVVLGASLQDTRYDNQKVAGPLNVAGIPNLFNIFNIGQAENKTQLMPTGWIEQTQSIFGSAELGLNNYLYLTVTGRNDWASQLANSPQASFFYPSVGLSGVITEMLSPAFRAKIRPVLNYLKLRVAYASVGSPFEHGITSKVYMPDKDAKVYKSNTFFPVGDLKPERTDSYEVGLSSRWFGGHLTIDGSVYRTLTKNQTLNVAVNAASGYSSMYIQTGEVRNQGVELSVGLNFGKRDGLYYNTNFTLGYNENKIIDLASKYHNPITGEEASLDRVEKGGLGSLKYILTKGGTLGDIYTTQDFNRDAQGNIYVDNNGTVGVKDLKEPMKLGSVLPKVNYGWTHELSWNGLSLGAMLTARQGGLVVSMTEAAMDNYGVSEASALARDNGGVLDGTNLIDARSYFTTRGKNRVAQYYTYSATNIRLAEAHITYRLSRKWIGNVADISLSLVGRNLALLYCKAPFDPESISGTGNYAQGLDYFMLPSQRTLGFSVKVNF